MTTSKEVGNALSKTKIGTGFKVLDYLQRRLVYKMIEFTKESTGKSSPYEITFER
jgi:hypothetical protein